MSIASKRKWLGVLVAIVALSGGLMIVEPVGAVVVKVSEHKNAFWASATITQGLHYPTNEEALDLADPGGDCTSSGGCNTVYFRYKGQNQFTADYTLSSYNSPTGCNGRVITVRYYENGQWKPLIRLNYLHLKSMLSSLTGTLDYAQEFNDWVGDVNHQEPAGCSWSGVHLHYSRSTNYGSSDANSVSSPLASDAVVFNGWSY